MSNKLKSHFLSKLVDKLLDSDSTILSSLGGALGATLVFLGLVADTDGDYEMQLQDTGSGTPSIARTENVGTSYALDADGVYRDIPANTPIWQGMRQVKNWLTYSNDFTQTGVWKTLSATISADGTITATGADGYGYHSTGVPNDTTPRISSVDIRRITGSGDIKLSAGFGGGTVIPVTGEWQRFAVAQTVSAANGFAVQIVTSGDAVQIRRPQYEMVDGQSDTSTPGEYIETTTTALTKYFGNANGNSVASNVVTEATGSPLSPQPSMHVDPELTNECIQSLDLGHASWTSSQLSARTENVTGLDGNVSAWTLTDSTTLNYGLLRGSATLPTTSAPCTIRVWIKKEASRTANLPGIQLVFNGGTKVYSASLNLDTGVALPKSGNAPDAMLVEDYGDFWCLYVQGLNDTGSGATLVDMYPSCDLLGDGVWDITAQGSGIFWQYELYHNKTIVQVAGSAPIFTTSSAVSNTPQISTWDAANHDPTVDQAFYFEYEGNVGDGTELLIHSNTTDGSTTFTDSSNNGNSLTPVGGTHHDTAQAKFGSSAIYFDDDAGIQNGGDCIEMNHDAFRPADKDFTMEFWLYHIYDGTGSWGGACDLVNGWDHQVNNKSFLLEIDETGGADDKKWYFLYSTTGADQKPASGYVSTNQIPSSEWVKLVVERKGTTLYMWMYRLSTDTWTLENSYSIGTDTIYASTDDLRIGCRYNSVTQPGYRYGLKGYMDEIRFTTGKAAYDGQQPKVESEPHPDPEPLVKNPILATQDTDTVLLIHSDTFDGDTDFVDSSYLDSTLGTYGNIAHTTDEAKFNASSIRLLGVSLSDYILIPNNLFDFGTGDGNISFWWWLDDLGTNFMFKSGGTNSGMEMYYTAVNGFIWTCRFSDYTKVDLVTNTADIAVDTWHYVELSKVGSTFRIFVDGVLRDTETNAKAVTQGATFKLGWGNDISYMPTGYFDEFRVQTIGGNTANYTPPTEPHDRGTLAQVEIAYVDTQGNLVIEDQNGAKATKALSTGVNKCGIFKESGNVGVTVGGSTGTLVASTGDIGGNGDIQVLHGVQSPAEIKDLRRYTGGSLQTTLETETT